MKNNIIKTLSVCLCAVLLVGTVGGAVFALTDNNKKNEKNNIVNTAAEVTKETEEPSKDETVYVLAGPDGAVRKIIVSDWIKNSLGTATLSDKTDLENIVNVKGDESYTMGGDKTAVWDAAGNDIYYQGNINKELPVTMTVTYKLDGKTVTPEELKGKSGRVTIRFDYKNEQYETVEIGGGKEKIYIPFAMLTGIILDNDVFTNVEITNGKLINDGSRTVVAGIAFPGLQEDLGIDREKFDIPDYVEITADAEDFSLGMTVTIATNELFSAFDAGKLDDMSELTDKLDELTDAIDQLMDGSSQLYDGLCTLLDKSGELVDGINELAEGALELKNGVEALDGGAANLQSGASQLADGLNTLASNNDALNDGAKQVFDTLLSSARTQLIAAGLDVPEMTVKNYAQVLNGVIASLDETQVYETALKTVTAAVEANRGYIEEQVTASVIAEVENGVVAVVLSDVEAGVIYAAAGMDKASYEGAVAAGIIDETIQSAINTAIEAQMQSDEVKAVINNNVNEQMASDDIKALIAQNTEAQITKAITDNMAGAKASLLPHRKAQSR